MPIQPAQFSKVLGDYPVEDSTTALPRGADGGTVAVDENEIHLAEDRAFLEAVGLADDGDSATGEEETGR